MRVSAIDESARFKRLSPPRLRRCRVVFPLEAGTGLTPARTANAASERTRPGCDQATMITAALIAPIPGSSSRKAPSLAATRAAISARFATSGRSPRARGHEPSVADAQHLISVPDWSKGPDVRRGLQGGHRSAERPVLGPIL